MVRQIAAVLQFAEGKRLRHSRRLALRSILQKSSSVIKWEHEQVAR